MDLSNTSTAVPVTPFNYSTTEVPYRLDDPTERLLIAIFTCTISLLGIPGNSLVIFAVCVSRKLQTSTNVFVANLAFSDFVTCLVLPFNTAALLFEEWPLPDSVCTVVGALTYITVGASIVNLALIAFNRYYLITRPRHKYDQLYRSRHMLLMIVFSWLYVTLVVLVPPACGFGNLGYSQRYRVCTTDSQHPVAFYYEMLRSILLQILNLIVIVICYTRIYSYVHSTGRSLSVISQADNMQRELRKRQIKVTKNLFMIVCAYVTCILPFGIACVIPRTYVVIPWVSMFALLNACVNPFIYGFHHPQFKAIFKRILTCQLREIEEPSFLMKSLTSFTTSVSQIDD